GAKRPDHERPHGHGWSPCRGFAFIGVTLTSLGGFPVVTMACVSGPAAACGQEGRRLYSPRGRSVAQPGRAPRSGRGGRRFKSCHSDQVFMPTIIPMKLSLIPTYGASTSMEALEGLMSGSAGGAERIGIAAAKRVGVTGGRARD